MSEMFVYITRPGASLKNPDTWLHHHHDFMSTTTLVTCVQHHLDHEGPELPELSLRHIAQDVALVVNHRSGKKCSFRKKRFNLGKPSTTTKRIFFRLGGTHHPPTPSPLTENLFAQKSLAEWGGNEKNQLSSN